MRLGGSGPPVGSMTSLEVLDRVVVLDELGVEHMLVGAFSAIAYGMARATKDADFVVA